MCLALPNPNNNNCFDGDPPGPVKLFFGVVAFLIVLLVAGTVSVFRRGNGVA